jgi:hypothetical protein
LELGLNWVIGQKNHCKNEDSVPSLLTTFSVGKFDALSINVRVGCAGLDAAANGIKGESTGLGASKGDEDMLSTDATGRRMIGGLRPW